MEYNYQKLGDICEVKGGKRLPKGAALIEEKNSHPYLRIVDFVNGGIDESNLKYVPKTVYEKIKRYTVSENDIFLSIVGTIGLCGTIPSNLEGANLTENAVKIYPKNGAKLNPLFLMYYLLSDIGQHQIDIRTVGSTQPKLAITRIKDIPVPKLNIRIQNKIVEILHSFTNKNDNNNKIISNLEELAQTLFKRWFVDFEFPNVNGEPYKSSGGKMVESELGMIPEGWNIGTLNDVGKIVAGGTPSRKIAEYFVEEGFSWVTPKDLSEDRSVYKYKGAIDITKEALEKSSAKLHPKNTVLFSSRAPIGYVAIAGQVVSTNQGFKSIIPNDIFSSEYIYLLLKHITPVIKSNAGGSTFKEISGKGMKLINTIIPTERALNEFYSIVHSFFEVIKVREKENKTLIMLRDTLLPKLLSGEIELLKEEKEFHYEK